MASKEMAKVIQRIERLENAVFGKDRINQKKIVATSPKTEIKFSLNERAFVKRYATKKSGSEKFTLMVAYATKGKVGETVSLSIIQKYWNNMKSLLGEFNRFHANEAKTRGWVDTKERGIYKLTDEWEQVL